MKTITYEIWVDEYLPKKNEFDNNAPYEGMMFETYGAELDYVLKLANSGKLNHIWTLINGENENTWIVPGYSIVDRMGYFVTDNAWEDENIEVDDNEHIKVKDAVEVGIEFAQSIGFTLNEASLDHWYFDEFKEETITVGDAKYHLIDYLESLDINLTSEQEDEIHNYYSQL